MTDPHVTAYRLMHVANEEASAALGDPYGLYTEITVPVVAAVLRELHDVLDNQDDEGFEPLTIADAIEQEYHSE